MLNDPSNYYSPFDSNSMYRRGPTMSERQRYVQALKEKQLLQERYRRQKAEETERRRLLAERRRAEEELYIRRQQHVWQQEQERMFRAKKAREEQEEMIRGQRWAAVSERHYRVKNPSSPQADSENDSFHTAQSDHSVEAEPVSKKKASQKASTQPTVSLSDAVKIAAATSLSSVVVEDASDSEGEDDLLKSVWNNRRPSPGLLMEPVEAL